MTRIVGIAGGSASGKTSLGQALLVRLGERACLVEQDAYYRDQAHLSLEARAHTNYDHPDALENALLARDLDALAAGHAIDLPRYDYATHTRAAETDRLIPRPVVLLTGLHVLGVPEIRERLGLKVYVEASPEVCLARRIGRDANNRGRDLPGVVAQWQATVLPMYTQFVAPSRRHADVVVDGEGALEEAVAAVLAALD